MLPHLPHPAKILRPTPYWEKRITQMVNVIFLLGTDILIPKYCYITLEYRVVDFRKGVKR
jgi:hypothetical protein